MDRLNNRLKAYERLVESQEKTIEVVPPYFLNLVKKIKNLGHL